MVVPLPGVAVSSAALFGKLPAHGDFVSRGLTRDEVERVDAWLSASLADAREALGDGFAERFDQALPWQCAGDGVAGAVAASQDAMGRRFPVLLVAGHTDAAQCESLLYAAIGEGWDADRLMVEIGETAQPAAIHAVDRWWCGDTELTGCRPPTLLTKMLAPPVAA